MAKFDNDFCVYDEFDHVMDDTNGLLVEVRSHLEKIEAFRKRLDDLEKLKLNYRLLEESKQVEQLTTSAEEIKSFLDKKLKDLLNLHHLWGKFEVCFHHVEEIFAEPDEDLFEYFEETDATFKDILQIKSALFDCISSPNLLFLLSSRFDSLYAEFEKARGSCTQAIYERCRELIGQLDENLAFVQTELRNVGEALYNKTSSPHNLIEKLKTLENSSQYNHCSEDLESLQSLSETLEALKYPDGSFKDKLEQFQTIWTSKQNEFMELEEQIEPELNIQNDYYEGLESLSEWMDTVEDLIESAKNADNYELFKEAEECFQELTMELDICIENASKLSSTVEVLSSNWTIPDLKEDFDSLMNRFDVIKTTISEVKTALPFMRDCYAFQSSLLEVLTWVQEMVVVLETEYVVESEEEICRELEKHKELEANIEGHKATVLETLKKGVEFAKGSQFSPEIIKDQVETLERLWKHIQELVIQRRDELEENLENWSSFVKQLETLMRKMNERDCLLKEKGDYMHIASEEGAEEKIAEYKVMEEALDSDLGIERDLVETADKIKEYATESTGEKLKMELDDLENLKQTVRAEIGNRIEYLTNEYQKWKLYNENKEQFEHWLKATEKQLHALSTLAIDLDTATRFQDLIEKIVTNHKTLELLNTLSSELSLDIREQKSMELRNITCNLNDRWDRLYEQAKCNLEYAKKHLSPWFSYRKKINEFIGWLAENEQIQELKPFQRVEDLKNTMEEQKVKLQNVTIKRPYLEDLI